MTSVCFNDSEDIIFYGSIDSAVTALDLRTQSPSFTLISHSDTVTSLRLSHEGTRLLSNSLDNTVRVWDVKPFSALPGRLITILNGATSGADRNLIRGSWSPDDSRVACGSGDRNVVVWDVLKRSVLYKLPGHKGTVNEVDWHPKEPIRKLSICLISLLWIVASASTDRSIYLGEITSTAVASYRAAWTRTNGLDINRIVQSFYDWVSIMTAYILNHIGWHLSNALTAICRVYNVKLDEGIYYLELRHPMHFLAVDERRFTVKPISETSRHI